VTLAAGGRFPFLPLYRADMIRLYGVDFIYDFFLIEL
jgi:hypothetical protein